MTEKSDNLFLPFIQPSQAQKHVTHNEALQILDVLTQLAVNSDEMSNPPANPTEGSRYVVGIGGTGDWAGHDTEVAVFESGSWRFFVPRAGWRAFVVGRETLIAFDGTDWIDLDSDDLQDIVQFGLGMATPVGTPFSAMLNAALWTALYQADGGSGDLLKTLNKETAVNDTGLVFQTDFETRAILGLFGNDNLRLSVSPDGSTFFDGLEIDTASGVVSQARLPRFKALTNFDNFCDSNVWSRIAINFVEFNDQNVFDAGTNQFTAPVSGSYHIGASLLFKQNTTSSVTTAGRLLKNGLDVIAGSVATNTGPHISEETTLQLQTLVELTAGDTVELEAKIAGGDGYFAANQTAFWGYKVG